ncbi:MAG: signal peptidase I [Gemmiger sp.]|nr:signal peptidase I [Gemmiger sp.]
MRIVSGIVRVMSWLVYLVIVLSLLIAAPILFGYKPIVVLSGSMEPAYPVGSITYYKQTAFENIAVGDAITFQIGESSLATHRVVAVNAEDQTFTTKGDHNDTEDATPVAYTGVQGKTVKFAIPYAGQYIAAVQHWYIIVACGLILLLDMLLSPERKKMSTGELVLVGLREQASQNTEDNP